ncbi:MAG: amino acid ABC transporter permease [Alphaproteobacteria bacterium]|nr:amino acid ABC transporter permease [Alphaproteobacteria bacterium]
MEAIADWFKWLNAAHGINLTIFYDDFDRARFLRGLLTTLWLSVVCIALSVVIGVVGAWVQGSRFRLLRRLVQGYIQFFRNTPPLIQLYFFYFAVGGLLPRVTDAHGALVPPVSNYAWAIISFSFFAGAFNVEIFRAGIEAVPRTTVEAAEALGYSRLKAYIHVVLPLAFRVSLPALNNNLVNLVKTTTLAYAIGVSEMLYAASQIWSEVLNVREMMNVLLIVYVLVVGALVWLMGRWERAMRMPGYGV